MTAVRRAALSIAAIDGSAERQATLSPATGWRRASTTRATSRVAAPSGTRSRLSPNTRIAAGRGRTSTRACAIRPPAAATIVAAPGARATTDPPLSTTATELSVLVQPTLTPGRTPPCPSVMVVASCSVSPSAHAVSAAGATPIQRTCCTWLMERTEEMMETRAAPADSEPAPHFHARTNQGCAGATTAAPSLADGIAAAYRIRSQSGMPSSPAIS